MVWVWWSGSGGLDLVVWIWWSESGGLGLVVWVWGSGSGGLDLVVWTGPPPFSSAHGFTAAPILTLSLSLFWLLLM